METGLKKNVYMCITEPHCWRAEMNTMLDINYILQLKKKRWSVLVCIFTTFKNSFFKNTVPSLLGISGTKEGFQSPGRCELEAMGAVAPYFWILCTFSWPLSWKKASRGAFSTRSAHRTGDYKTKTAPPKVKVSRTLRGQDFPTPTGRISPHLSLHSHMHAHSHTHTRICTFQPASADVLPCVRWLHFLAPWLDWGGALNSPPGPPGLVLGRGRNRTALGFTEKLRAHLCGPAPCWWEKGATWTKGPSLEGTHPSNPGPQDVIGSINITSYLPSSPQLLFISLFSFFPCWFFSVFSLFHSYFFKNI